MHIKNEQKNLFFVSTEKERTKITRKEDVLFIQGKQYEHAMMNKVVINGSVVRKNFQKGAGRLYLTIAVFGRSKEGTVVDYPTFIYEGEMAKRVDQLIPEALIAEKKAYVEAEGFLETARYLHKVEGERNRFEWVWLPRVTGTKVTLVPSVRSKNEVTISARVRNVWKNQDPNKHFYYITLEDDNKHTFSVIYFEHKMLLEPKIGEILDCDAVIHTRTVNRNGRRETEFSVNAWRITRPDEENSVSSDDIPFGDVSDRDLDLPFA